MPPTIDVFLARQEVLRRDRVALTWAAANLHPGATRLAGGPLLTRPEWQPPAPVPLDRFALSGGGPPIEPDPAVQSTVAARLPRRPDGTPYPTHSAAVADLCRPAVFDDLACYGLVAADLTGTAPHGAIRPTSFYTTLDLAQPLALEVASDPSRLGPVRRAAGSPYDLSRGFYLCVGVLTLRVDPQGGEIGFLLHERNSTVVGNAGLTHLVPAGVHQPEPGGNYAEGMPVWATVRRETLEELCPPGHTAAERLDAAHRAGLVRPHVLALAVDPLTFGVELLVVNAVRSDVFDDLFAHAAQVQGEGRLVGSTGTGLPLTDDTLRTLRQTGRLSPATDAALALALEHRQTWACS